MKKITLILSMVFTLNLASLSYANWVKVGMNAVGETFYLNEESIRRQEGHVYVWSLVDRQKPNHVGYFSTQTYRQIDCEFFRFKILKYSFHEEAMGIGKGNSFETQNPNWLVPAPSSYDEFVLQTVCEH